MFIYFLNILAIFSSKPSFTFSSATPSGLPPITIPSTLHAVSAFRRNRRHNYLLQSLATSSKRSYLSLFFFPLKNTVVDPLTLAVGEIAPPPLIFRIPRFYFYFCFVALCWFIVSTHGEENQEQLFSFLIYFSTNFQLVCMKR